MQARVDAVGELAELVAPAKAGAQNPVSPMSRWPLDPGFRRDDDQQSGATTAITGLILNYLSVLLMVLGICFMILVFGGALAFLGLNADEFQQMLTPMP